MLASNLYLELPDTARSFDDWNTLEKEWLNVVSRSSPPHRWIFRGHEKSEWPFETTLERAIWSHRGLRDELGTMPGDAGKSAWLSKKADLQREYLKMGLKRHFAKRNPGPDEYVLVLDIEGGLIRRFQRQCHHYLTDTPEEDNLMEWLALMRHFGAPTRLMDWTWSFYVAVFFAIHRTEEERCAVWALDLDALDKARPVEKVRGLIDKDPNVKDWPTFEGVFKQNHNVVVNVSAFRLNERLLVQQGTFLVPGNVTVPFEDNLSEVLEDIKKPEALVKFNVSANRDTKQDILRKLHEMNIGRATLFPGLDGFAQSLDQLLTIPRSAAAV
jgi:FRG domain